MENKHNVLTNADYLLHVIQQIRKVTGLGNNVMVKDLPKEIEKMLFRTKLKERALQRKSYKLKREIFNRDNP
jgi:hypothetical protein